jgi:hypothetical protein
MIEFVARLCQINRHNGQFETYNKATIEAVSVADAIRLAKHWAGAENVRDGSWLRVMHKGKVVASLMPGDFSLTAAQAS